MIPLAVSDKVCRVRALIMVNMLEAGQRTGIGNEKIGRAGAGSTHPRSGNDRTILVAAVDLNVRVIENVEVVENFVRLWVASESVQPVTADTFIADDFESEIAVDAGGRGSRRRAHVLIRNVFCFRSSALMGYSIESSVCWPGWMEEGSYL